MEISKFFSSLFNDFAGCKIWIHPNQQFKLKNFKCKLYFYADLPRVEDGNYAIDMSQRIKFDYDAREILLSFIPNINWDSYNVSSLINEDTRVVSIMVDYYPIYQKMKEEGIALHQ